MAGEIRIETAGPDDEAAISAVLSTSYGDLLRPYYAAETLARVLPMMGRAQAHLLASGRFFKAFDDACDGGRVIACGGWSLEVPGTREIAPGLAHLRHFATHPDAIGRGAGRAIAERCIAEATASGASELESDATLMAEGFYARLGFRTIGFHMAKIGGHDFAAVKMRMALGQPAA